MATDGALSLINLIIVFKKIEKNKNININIKTTAVRFSAIDKFVVKSCVGVTRAWKIINDESRS